MWNIVIVGAGGFGREVRHIFHDQIASHESRFKGFLGKDHGVAPDPRIQSQLLGDPEAYSPQPQDRFLLAIGHMETRRRVVECLESKGGRFLTLVHPSAFVASSAQLGEGVLIYPRSVVSHEAFLADHVKLNYFTCVGHNAQLGRYCLLAPYATVNGFGVLEDDVYLSTHTTVGPQVRIGARSKLSANSAVTQDVPPDSFVFGVPGRVVSRPRLR